jgi:hypothetical protein
MLEPEERTLLFDALKPPAGYELDRALITSYTLDLTAVLTVPALRGVRAGAKPLHRGGARPIVSAPFAQRPVENRVRFSWRMPT